MTQRTVAKYMVHRIRHPPSQNWRTFLRNHLSSRVPVDFLTVPTLTFQMLHHYHLTRTHLGLVKDASEPRPVQGPGEGEIVVVPLLGGLHFCCELRTA